MDATELTFGVEIETTVPPRLFAEGLTIGSYHHGVQVPYLPDGWTAQSDSSVHGEGRYGCEIVSPILQGVEGLRQVALVLRTLEEKGHRVNDSCGVHVHIGWSRSLPSTTLARLITIVSYLEKGIFAITGSKRRETGSYCKPVRCYGDDKQAKRRLDGDRYHVLNLRNLATGVRETVEFRAFSGSLNPTKVVGWIQVCLGIVQRAQNGKRSPSWDPKAPQGGWKKNGAGASEAERLMGYLGWGAGYAKTHGGVSYGWIAPEDLVGLKAVQKEFRRLAAKYDEPASASPATH